MDAATLGAGAAVGSSLLTLATVLWRGGAMAQTLKNVDARVGGLHAKVDKINGRVRENEKSVTGCQAYQENCPHAHADIQHD